MRDGITNQRHPYENESGEEIIENSWLIFGCTDKNKLRGSDFGIFVGIAKQLPQINDLTPQQM